MDYVSIIEFAEKGCGVKLTEWQKEYLRVLSKLPKDTKIYLRVLKSQGKRQFYIYMKELLEYGPTIDRK